MHKLKSAYCSDTEIIKGIIEGKNIALEILYKQNFSTILQFILGNNGSEQEAKDIYQEAIIVFYNKIRNTSFKLECKIKTYLYSVCRRLWLNELKNKKLNAGGITEYDNFTIFNNNQENDFLLKEKQLNIMYESLAILGEPCKTILYDFYIGKINMQQVAKKMGYTNTDNAKNQKYKCLQRLKKIYFKTYDIQ